jgi:hypothetical protein
VCASKVFLSGHFTLTVKLEAERRKVEWLVFPTEKAIEFLNPHPQGTNAVLHITC